MHFPKFHPPPPPKKKGQMKAIEQAIGKICFVPTCKCVQCSDIPVLNKFRFWSSACIPHHFAKSLCIFSGHLSVLWRGALRYNYRYDLANRKPTLYSFCSKMCTVCT